jgi:hypothetical protein
VSALVDEPLLLVDDETEAERAARAFTEVVLDEVTQELVNSLVDKLVMFANHLSGRPYYPYQEPLARRMFESVIIGDGAMLTALFSRQSGKTETVANTISTLMIMLPRLAKAYPSLLGKFERGVWVGVFAPVEDQAKTLYTRIIACLTSERAKSIFADPEINEWVIPKGSEHHLGCGSLVRFTTAHPRASIESPTYHVILIDEAQGADSYVVNKSILPMTAATGGSTILTGTPDITKNVFYNTIQTNKREMTRRGNRRDNHFEADYLEAGKYNPEYMKKALLEMLRLGEESTEFKMMYRILWLLESGMFVTAERLDQLGDRKMRDCVPEYYKTPIVVGIDCGRKQDRTILTAVWVDWSHPDQFGKFNHRIINWLDLEGMGWEDQYFHMQQFLSKYRLYKVGVDTNGLGDVVVSRMRRIMPQVEFVDLGSAPSEQSKRWKHLNELINSGKVSWPAGDDARQRKVWKRFRQEMEDLEVEYKPGGIMIGRAPKVAHAHDDYPDSLSMACILTTTEEQESVEEVDNFMYAKNHRSY